MLTVTWQLSCSHRYAVNARTATGSGDVAWCNECRRSRVLDRIVRVRSGVLGRIVWSAEDARGGAEKMMTKSQSHPK